MGAQLSLITPSANTIGLEAYVLELENILYEKRLNNSRFLKTVKGRDQHGPVTVKVFIKPAAGIHLDPYAAELERQRVALTEVKNAIAYSRLLETDRAGYMVRQYLRTNLYDRISTRPFLTNIEKRWISYQLIHGLHQCHLRGVVHGDIKTENIMVTAANWIYLADFSPYKPTYLPQDDPAPFSFYFDTSLRRSCYIAPERFVNDDRNNKNNCTNFPMDIFSLGCVIAELFLEGTPIFTLSQLFKYRKGEYEPPLHYIEDREIQQMVKSMIKLDPIQRGSTREYLHQFDNLESSLPTWFASFLHPYISSLVISDSTSPEWCEQSNQRIERIYTDFSLIAKELQFDLDGPSEVTESRGGLPVVLDLPGLKHHIPRIRSSSPNQDNALLILSLVCADIRNTTRAKYKLMACDLLLILGEQINDEAKLDRCLPYLLTLLDDSDPLVQTVALTNLCHLLTLVTVLTPVNDALFAEYISPKLTSSVLQSSKVNVRACYASCLSTLAQTASRFQAMSRMLQNAISTHLDPDTEVTGGSSGLPTSVEDFSTKELQDLFEDHTVILLTDSSAAVKCALLHNIRPLCMFFGEHKTNDVILSHLITYLNDKDVKVKLAFFEATIQLSTFIGITSLELYILPLLVQTLTDADEFVVQKILQCLALFADAHLIRSPYIWELIKVVIKFAAHPNQWIRQTMFAFIATTVRQISPAETYCLLYPVLRPFLVCDLIDFTEPTLLACAKPPLSRSVFNLVVTWAQKARRSYYWKISHQRRNNIKEVNTSNGSSSVASSSTVLSESIALRYNGNTGSETALNNAHRIELSTEDEQWLIKLQSIGFKQNKDLWKINVLRDFIYNIAHTVHNKPHGIESLLGSNHDLHLSLSKLKIMPFNVFFDDSLPSRRGSAKTSLAITSGESTVGTSITRTTATALTPPTPIPVNRVKFATNGITSSRSSPSTGTITTMAYGEVETPGRLQSQTSTLATTLESHENNNSNNNSSYTGKDPYILQFLANFSLDLAEFVSVEFGPSITPKENISLHEKLPAGNGRKPHWKPTGVLVSNLHEHTAPITRLVVSPDHEFFVSASDDGYIKVWDTQRLESTVTSHAMLTYKFGDTQVKAMCLVEKYHVVVATGVDGWVKLLRIYVRPKTGKARGKYRKIEVINQYNVNKSSSGIEGEYASDVHTLKLEKRLLIVLITTDSRIIILDANTLCEINVMQNPPEHGWLTSSVVDKDGNWVLVGTSKGVLDLWDLRFQLLIKSWGISGGSVVYRLVLHPHHSAKWICVAGGSGQSEVTVWDIETSQCVEVYRGSGNSEAGKGYDPVSVIDTSDFKVSQLNAEEFDTELLSKDHIIKSSGHGVHTVFADTEFEYSAGSLEYSRRSFLISAGSDKITRLWDMSNIEASTIVNGLVTGAGKPIYTVSFPTSSMTFNTERLYVPHHKENEAKRPGKLPRASIISTEQRNNMRNHRDTIMDAVLLLSPYKMIVTGDRSGVIKVFY